MKLHEIKIKFNKGKKRIGRGAGSGRGKTAGRGTKGQKSRSGGNIRPGFEGGQMSLIQRIPKKRGFTSLRPKAKILNLSDLEKIKSNIINKEKLVEIGFIKDKRDKVKILGKGEIKKKLTVSVDSVSQSAREKIIKAGGTIKNLS